VYLVVFEQDFHPAISQVPILIGCFLWHSLESAIPL